MVGVSASGPATVCYITFFDEASDRAGIGCFYGPGGNTSSSISSSAVTDAPNLFDYCKMQCPDHDALHSCWFVADNTGVQHFNCQYGQVCD
jgi:hypothetical protein